MYREALLNLFRHPGESFSLEFLADQAGTDVAAMSRHLNELKDHGILAWEMDGDLVKYQPPDNDLNPLLIQYLNCGRWGRELFLADDIDSTNEWAAKAAAGRVLAEGALFAARTQSGGKGRHGRRWIAPLGGLWFTLILIPDLPPAAIPSMSLVFGLTITRVLKTYSPDIRVKWPNDVMAGGRKITGILLETAMGFDRINYVVVGIGINVNNRSEMLPPEIKAGITSLAEMTGKNQSLSWLLVRLLEALEADYRLYKSQGFQAFRDEFRAQCLHLGQEVTVMPGKETITGTNIDIGPGGELILRDDQGLIVTVNTGDVLISR